MLSDRDVEEGLLFFEAEPGWLVLPSNGSVRSEYVGLHHKYAERLRAKATALGKDPTEAQNMNLVRHDLPAAELTIRNLTSGILKAETSPRNQSIPFPLKNRKTYSSYDDIPYSAPLSIRL